MELFGLMFLCLLPLLVSVLFLAWDRRERRRRLKAPFVEAVMRPVGYSLEVELRKVMSQAMDRLMLLLLTPLVISLMIFVTVYFQGSLSLLLVLLGLCLGIGAVVFHTPRLRLERRRVAALRLGIFGELVTAEYLRPLEADGCRVIHDVPFEGFNIDHVLVAPNGVFAIETKARSKQLNGDAKQAARLRFDGKALYFPNAPKFANTQWLDQASRQAKSLATMLSAATGERVKVEGVVSVPGWFVENTGRFNHRVLNPKMFHVLQKVKCESLSAERMKRIVFQLEQLVRDVTSI